MYKNQHVVTHHERWAVRGEGNEKVTSIYSTQLQAMDAAKGIAIHQKSDVIIHGKDGKIRDRDSYGNDPMPPRDRKF